MIAPVPIRHELVLVGGGHAHVEVLKRFGMQPLPGARLTLVSPSSAAPYSGMLPGLIAGHYQTHETHVELRPLCRFAGAQFLQAPVAGLDLARRLVLFRNRPPIAFDTLSLNIGSTPALQKIPGAVTHGVPVKPVDRLLEGWSALRDQLLRNPPHGEPFRVVVVGGGAGGVELLLALRHRLLAEFADASPTRAVPEFHLVNTAEVPLPAHSPAVQRRIARILLRDGVRVHTAFRVLEALPSEILGADGRRLPFDALFWAIHASAPDWPAESGLATDPGGFVAVHPCLRSTSHPFVFAAGDIASVLEHPRPKSGVFAVRQGPPLADNLRRAVLGEGPAPFRPQSRALNLIATGAQHAIASYGPLALSGAWVWTLKDRIDRRWMRRYQELPPMNPGRAASADSPSAVEPGVSPGEGRTAPQRPCGGCAAKVPAEALTRVLHRLQPLSRPGILVGLDAPDDAAVVSPPLGLSLVQTVDSFRSFIEDPYLFGRIATLHGLNDLFAMGTEPHSALAIATVPFGSPRAVEETLFQVLSGALAELDAHGTALIGGHSSEGPELAFGLSLNGFATPERLLRKRGLKPGDVLILTKSLGTGTLFAADMIGKARGAWIEGALRSMRASGRDAARCFLRHQASACTDVSGFGLLGHLLEMLRASGVSASLDLDAVPALDGALETIRRGVVSSLHPENRRACSAFAASESTLEADPRFELLFDPQTSGGLLAGVPEEHAGSCLEALHQAGCPDAVALGTIEVLADGSSPPRIRWVNAANRK